MAPIVRLTLATLTLLLIEQPVQAVHCAGRGKDVCCSGLLWVGHYHPKLHQDLSYDVVEEFVASAEMIGLASRKFSLLACHHGLHVLALLQHHYPECMQSLCDRSHP